MSDDVKKYLIDGVECTQTYLTIEKTEQILELLDNLPFAEMTSPGIVGRWLFKEKKFEKFMEIILDAPRPVAVKRMRLSQGVEIVRDFLCSDEVSLVISGIFSAMNTLTGKMEMVTAAASTPLASTPLE
jgi:hypothetical protein